MSIPKSSATAEVRQLCEAVSSSNTRNLWLLRAIEQTVGWLVWLQNRYKSDASFAAGAAEYISGCERKKIIDEDGTLCTLFEDVETGLAETHNTLKSKIQATREAPELNGSDKRAIVTEYEKALVVVADLHNQMLELRWAVGEHDADLEKPSGPVFTDADALRKYLSTI